MTTGGVCQMDDKEEVGEAEDSVRFPLQIRHRAQMEIIALIRSHLVRMSPPEIRSAAVTLLALERLPLVAPEINISFGFCQQNIDGNYKWADIKFSENSFSLHVGEHFYDPDIGGDTETDTTFEAFEGDERCLGSIQRWLEVARSIAEGSPISCEDYSDHERLDWKADVVNGWGAE